MKFLIIQSIPDAGFSICLCTKDKGYTYLKSDGGTYSFRHIKPIQLYQAYDDGCQFKLILE